MQYNLHSNYIRATFVYTEISLMKCIVVDDDPVQREAIRSCINRVNDLELVGMYPNAIEARIALQKRHVDLIFLDVEMPEMSGIEFLASFKEVPQVIMVTAKKQYAFEAFEYDVTDYISKPVDMDRFSSAVQRARYYEDNLSKPDVDNSIFIKSDGVLVKLSVDDVYYVEALGDYIKVVTDEKRYIVHSTMKAFVAKLPENFLRVHKSHIINIDKIEKLEENTVFMTGQEIPVSRNNKKILVDRLSEKQTPLLTFFNFFLAPHSFSSLCVVNNFLSSPTFNQPNKLHYVERVSSCPQTCLFSTYKPSCSSDGCTVTSALTYLLISC